MANFNETENKTREITVSDKTVTGTPEDKLENNTNRNENNITNRSNNNISDRNDNQVNDMNDEVVVEGFEMEDCI